MFISYCSFLCIYGPIKMPYLLLPEHKIPTPITASIQGTLPLPPILGLHHLPPIGSLILIPSATRIIHSGNFFVSTLNVFCLNFSMSLLSCPSPKNVIDLRTGTVSFLSFYHQILAYCLGPRCLTNVEWIFYWHPSLSPTFSNDFLHQNPLVTSTFIMTIFSNIHQPP